MNIFKKSKQRIFVAHILMSIFLLLPVSPAVLAQGSLYFTDIKTEQENNITFKIIWKTSISSSGRVVYGKDKNNLSSYIVDSTESKYHKVSIGNLEGETTYYYKITIFNKDGIADSSIKSFKTEEYNDGRAPIISDMEMPYVTETIAVFKWETNEKSTSWVEYGDANNKYAHSAGDNNLTKDHVVVIKNLIGNVKYYARIYSVDEDGNKSSVSFRDFSTRDNRDYDEDLVISNLRPVGQNDPNIFSDAIKITFKTNHYAKGNVTLKSKSGASHSKEVGYGLNHEIEFSGLKSSTEYDISLKMNDVFGKNDGYEVLAIRTLEREEVDVCGIDSSEYAGYYGQYFNLPNNIAYINDFESNGKGKGTGWFDESYLSFSRIDTSLNFTGEFLPIESEGLANDPYYFSAYWRATIDVPEDGKYEYDITVDNSGWVYIDGDLKTDLGQRLPIQVDNKKVYLSKGLHSLEIFFVERGPGRSLFNFKLDERITPHPWTESCYSAPVHGDVVVKGVEFSMYTPATAIYKTSTSPSIYAIVNNQSHYISSPSSFEKYGYDWGDIKTVSDNELAKYPRARLIRSAENSAIYFLYQRPENQWLKIAMPSPTVFVSYPSNHWGNVIVVTQEDVDSYPDVKLIRTKNDPAVYYLENGVKRFVSYDIFVKKGFNFAEVAEVNDIHMNSYRIGEDLK